MLSQFSHFSQKCSNVINNLPGSVFSKDHCNTSSEMNYFFQIVNTFKANVWKRENYKFWPMNCSVPRVMINFQIGFLLISLLLKKKKTFVLFLFDWDLRCQVMITEIEDFFFLISVRRNTGRSHIWSYNVCDPATRFPFLSG